MDIKAIEALYLTANEVADYLNVNRSRVSQLTQSGYITKIKGGMYDRASVEDYKRMRGDKKGGPYPKGGNKSKSKTK